MARKREKLAALERENTLQKRWAVVAQLLVYALIVIFPFVLGEHGNADAVYRKEIFLYIAVGAALLGFIVCYLLAAKNGQRPNLRIWSHFKQAALYEKALILYTVLMLLSFLFSADWAVAFWGVRSQSGGLLVQGCYIAMFFLIARYYRPTGRDIIIATAIAAATAVIGLCQYFGNDFLGILPERYAEATGQRVVFFSTMSNYNFYSTYLCVFFGLGAGWMVSREDRWSLLLLPALLAIFAMVLFGEMRGGLVGIAGAVALGLPVIVRSRSSFGKLLLLGAGFFLVFLLEDIARVHVDTAFFGVQQASSVLRPFFIPGLLLCLAAGLLLLLGRDEWFAKIPLRISAKWLRRGWYILLAVLLIAACVLMPTIAELTGNQTLGELAGILSGNLDDNYASGRLYIWKRAVTLIPESPILGFGPDGFNAAFNRYYAYELVDDWPTIMQPAVFDKAHNDFMQVLIDGGILGFAAYVAFFFALFWTARKKTASALIGGGLLAVIGYIVQSNFNYVIPVNGPTVWVALSMYGAMIRTASEINPLKEGEMIHGQD